LGKWDTNIGGWRIKTKQYIKLPGTSNQKIRQKYYTPESITHPAKANIPMMHWILKNFVQDGDIVLDPMAGIFTTGVEGMRLFPNSLFIGVELEGKFVKMTRANIKKVEKIGKKDMFMKIGKAVCVQGDARDLSKIMKEKVNKIISSPPYAERYAYKDPENKQKDDPYASKRDRIHKPYSQNPNNIGNLNYGTADKIISSPPFQQAGTDTEKRMKERLDKVFKGRSYVPTQKYRDKENISNIKSFGQVDKIISSPPFGQAQSGGGIAKKGYDGPKHTPTDMVGKRSYMPENVGGKDNISNLPYGQAEEKTYLGEMLKVYQECFKILKARGLMILIVKDFIRNKKRVRLGEDTIKLCQAAGFTFKEIYHRKIEHPSFWRVLYQQKHPEVEKIDSEDILIFEKTPSPEAG